MESLQKGLQDLMIEDKDKDKDDDEFPNIELFRKQIANDVYLFLFLILKLYVNVKICLLFFSGRYG